MANSSNNLVLLTGGTGFLGYPILIDLLKAGYDVRAAVRSEAGADKIRVQRLVKDLELTPGRLSYEVVPDLAAPGAFDGAVRGVNYVVHVAAPVPSFGAGTGAGASEPVAPEQYDKFFVRDAVDATLGILRSAAAAGGSVRRVVLTSSAVAVIPFSHLAASPDADYSVQFGPESRLPDPVAAAGPGQGGGSGFASEVEAYAAGKTAALNAAERWIAGEGAAAGFDLVSILPGWAFGRDRRMVAAAAKLRSQGTNSVLLGLLLGGRNDWPYNGNAALVADVVRAHVQAVDPAAVPGGRSLVVSSPMVWEDALDVLRSEADLADAVGKGLLSIGGKQPTQAIAFDGSATEDALGFRFAPFQEAVRQVARQYLELLAKA